MNEESSGTVQRRRSKEEGDVLVFSSAGTSVHLHADPRRINQPAGPAGAFFFPRILYDAQSATLLTLARGSVVTTLGFFIISNLQCGRLEVMESSRGQNAAR